MGKLSWGEKIGSTLVPLTMYSCVLVPCICNVLVPCIRSVLYHVFVVFWYNALAVLGCHVFVVF